MWKVSSTKTLKKHFPRIATYREVGEFLHSQNTTKDMIVPELQVMRLRLDPEMHLVASKQVYETMKEELRKKRELAVKHREILDEQWNDLEKSEKLLRDNFVKLSNFIRSNGDKRSRASDRIREDLILIKEREAAIEKLHKKIKFLEANRAEVDKEIQQHKPYEHFLHSVIAISLNEFKNEESVVNRYESLIHTRMELAERQNVALLDLERAKSKLGKIAEENMYKIMGMRTVLASLHSRHQTATNYALHWESIVHSIKKQALLKVKEIMEVKQSCKNTYLMMCRRKGETPKIPDDNFELQLVYIKRTLRQLDKVRRRAVNANKKIISSTKVTTSKES